jgi:dTDP-4-amino-4,6-dideoxygalactose transaminase
MISSSPPSMLGPPAIMGGRPAFAEGLPLARPSIPNPRAVAVDVARILESGVLTNGPYVEDFETQAAAYLGVKHCVAVASCTSGMMVLLRACDLSGDVVLPSFTFAATAHAVAWNGLRPVFADVDQDTLTVSPAAVARAVGLRTSAILATHTYGTPSHVDELSELAEMSGIRLFFDAAHAFGSRHGDSPVGRFGDAEVFSFTPTKPLVAGEGGLIATNDDDLAERCRLGRDYGKEPDYDFQFVGLNARMSEFHAAVGLASMAEIESRVEARNHIADLYHMALSEVPGLTFPQVRSGDRSTYKDFTVLIEPEEFGAEAAWAAIALRAEGIETRRYYSPPVHATRAYRYLARGDLPVTESAAARVLTLPLWMGMTEIQVGRVAEALRRIHAHVIKAEARIFS